MHRTTLSALFLGLIASSVGTLFPYGSAEAAPIYSRQLVNMRVGDGTTTPTGTALPVRLDVYNVTYTAGVPTSVTLAQTIPMPIATSGTAPTTGNRYLAAGGTAAAEGGLALSVDRRYMTLAGYNQIVGGPTNPGAAGTEDRVVGFVDLSTGTVDTTTAFTGYSGSGPGATAVRGAISVDGTNVWMAASTGVRYGTPFTDNPGTGIAIDGTNNARRNVIYEGQLYQSENANSRHGVEKVGTGLPTTAASATMTLLPGFPTSGLSTYDFFFADDNTIYIADDRGTGTGGLQKWTFNGSTWSMVYSLLVNPGAGNRGIKTLTGRVDKAGNVVMFGSTTDTTANFLYGFTDTLANTNVANVTANKLVTASTDFTGGSAWNLRGVALAIPEPASIAILALGSTMLLAVRRRNA
jgi:hypothetical protein